MARLEGSFICPEGAACVTAVRQLRESGWLAETDEVVVLNTGTGLIYPDTVPAAAPVLPPSGRFPRYPRRSLRKLATVPDWGVAEITLVKGETSALDRTWMSMPDGSTRQVAVHVVHDLPHLVVESMFGIEDGLWGVLARGGFARREPGPDP